jgi:hypothetical protein
MPLGDQSVGPIRRWLVLLVYWSPVLLVLVIAYVVAVVLRP